MSTIQPEAKQAEPVTANGAESGSIGTGKASPAPTITNQRGISEPAMIPAHGNGRLRLGREGDSNPNAGRTPERLRRAATDALEGQIDDISKLLGLIVKRATKELGPDGSLGNATSVLSQVSKLAATLTSIGPGTKITNVVETPELIRKALDAYRSLGYGPEDCVRFNDALVRELE